MRVDVGDFADLEGEGKTPTAELLESIHRAKTGALLRASLRMGAIYAGACDEQYGALSCYGEHIGLAFQIVDDILDVEESSAALGKTAERVALRSSGSLSARDPLGAKAIARPNDGGRTKPVVRDPPRNALLAASRAPRMDASLEVVCRHSSGVGAAIGHGRLSRGGTARSTGCVLVACSVGVFALSAQSHPAQSGHSADDSEGRRVWMPARGDTAYWIAF